MFNLEKIKERHAKVKSGADFPAYIQDLKKMGVTAYENYVSDGHTAYFGDNNFQLVAGNKYPVMEIDDIGSAEKLKHSLLIHQQGKTDYPTFCKDAANAGVEKWKVDIQQLTCTYYDKKENKLLTEKIPVPDGSEGM